MLLASFKILVSYGRLIHWSDIICALLGLRANKLYPNFKKICFFQVKCLLTVPNTDDGKPLVLSFSGCHDDDEAVLRWSREKDEVS